MNINRLGLLYLLLGNLCSATIFLMGGVQASPGVNWDAIAACESGGNWAINTGRYEGGLQFLNSSWLSVKAPEDPPHAYQASKEAQIAAANRLLARSGIGQWPVCGRRAG